MHKMNILEKIIAHKKKEVAELRIKTIEKQEKQMKEKASAMQTEVMKQLKEK